MEEIKGDAAVDEVVLYNRKEDVHVVVETSGVFIAIGEEPLNEVAKVPG